MPFENVKLHGVEKNFEQVLNGFIAYLKPASIVIDKLPPIDGWKFHDFVAAFEQMVGDAADRLYETVNTVHEQRISILEKEINDPNSGLAGTVLIVARLEEQLNALQLTALRATP